MSVEHHREVVRIAELADEMGRIEARVFIDCEILGPAVLAPLEESAFVNNVFTAADVEAALWEVHPERVFVGAIALFQVSFTRCRFTNIGIVGTRETLDAFRSSSH